MNATLTNIWPSSESIFFDTWVTGGLLGAGAEELTVVLVADVAYVGGGPSGKMGSEQDGVSTDASQ